MSYGLGQVRISVKMRRMIYQYYRELYVNLEMKSTTEIAKELDVDSSTVRRFFNTLDLYPNTSGEFGHMAKIILLCTNFGSGSPYLESQKLLADEIENRRRQKRRNEIKEAFIACANAHKAKKEKSIK